MRPPATSVNLAPPAENFPGVADVRRWKCARPIKFPSLRRRLPFWGASRRCFRGILIAFLIALPLLPATGQSVTNEPPLPYFMASKYPMPDQLLKDKRVDGYMTGFPALGYNPESGFTFGGIGQLFDNGPTNSPFFRYAPYRERYLIGATASTGGNLRAVVGYDRPYVNDTPWRIRSAAGFAYTSFENYFGIGDSTLHPLTYPGSMKEFSN